MIPPIEPPADTKYVRHIEIKSERYRAFWGRDMYLGAHVLVPEGFDEHPEARYPLMIFHGHFPADFGDFRTEPPDPDLECEYCERFQLDCYNRIQQQEAYDFYRHWISDEIPRFLIVEIQHANPFYDDSYAVNSANLGPYGDAITYELIPEIERRFRGIGEGWARFLVRRLDRRLGGAGGAGLLPRRVQRRLRRLPGPHRLPGLHGGRHLRGRQRLLRATARSARSSGPAHRDYLGHVTATLRDYNHLELALGTRSRSGDQCDIWEAVYSPVGDDGYPKRIWDKLTGEIDPEVAEHWRRTTTCGYILRRDWATLGPKLAGKIHIYCGDMDNYYLNNAVYLIEEFLESTTDPYYAGEVDYGDRAEHCWNGDHENGNGISRLRYNTLLPAQDPEADRGVGAGGGRPHQLALLAARIGLQGAKSSTFS